MIPSILLILLAFLALLLGYPVGLTLGGVAILFALIGTLFGFFDSSLFHAIPPRLFGIMTNPLLVCVPLFIFMGVLLQRSGLAHSLFESLSHLLRHRRGGLPIAVTLVGALLATMTGIVGASITTLGLMALPILLQRNLSPSQATGCIASSGTLGQIIPPSIVLIILADQLSIAHRSARSLSGQFSADPVLVPDLFTAALLPSFLLVVFYIVWHYLSSPPMQPPPAQQSDSSLTSSASPSIISLFFSLLPITILIFLTLGVLLTGIATPTEAACFGCIGAIFLVSRKFSSWQFWFGVASTILFFTFHFFELNILRNFFILCFFLVLLSCCFTLWRVDILRLVLSESVHLVSIIFLIIFGTSIFALVFRGFGGDTFIHSFLSDLPGGTMSALFLVMLTIFLLGFFLEFLEITYLVIPLTAPILLSLPMSDGSFMHPLWLGVLIALNLQTSFLTPPLGISLFYLRSVSPSYISTLSLYRGIIPFVIIQLLVLFLVFFYPTLAIWFI